MKKSSLIVLLAMLTLIFCISGTALAEKKGTNEHGEVKIYLYGEHHAVEWILKEEIELWRNHYTDENIRHLFIEYPYYTAEFLNIWMQSESDEILDQIHMDAEGTAAYGPYVRQFFKTIKEEFPGTVFHGTDVGHQYLTTGKRFLDYLKKNGLEDSEKYSLAEEAIMQGKYYYTYSDGAYRENKMVDNFIREFENLDAQSIVGIYGSAHTDFNKLDFMTGTVPSMAAQLKEHYGGINSIDLALQTDPSRKERIEIDGREFDVSFLGKQDITGLGGFSFREFWLVEDAYDYCKKMVKTGDVLPFNNYPTEVEVGQVFKIDCTMLDGSLITLYYRSDGVVWNGLPTTEGFLPDEY